MTSSQTPKTKQFRLFGDKKLGLLWTILILSLALHLVVGLIFGSFVIFKHIFKQETTFEPAPEIVRTIDPRKIEHKVKVQESQQNSGRPQVQPRLTANKVSEISLPEVKVDLTPVKDQLQERIVNNFRTDGFGTGLGSASGSGGLGTGVSKVNFFGIQAQGERIAFLVDISRSMVEDERGGLPGFEVLKNEIKNMIDKLNDGTFFNVILFDVHVDLLFNGGLKLANAESKAKAKELIDRYYRAEDFATHEQVVAPSGRSFVDASKLRNFTPPVMESVRQNISHGTTRIDHALLAAFRDKADTIFILADGSPTLWKQLDEEERERLNQELERDREKHDRLREEYFKNLNKENERRARRGLPPKIVEVPPIPVPGPPRLTDKEVLDYIKALSDEFYGPGRKNRPPIYTVGYVADKESEKFLKDLARDFRGRFRPIRGMARPIK